MYFTIFLNVPQLPLYPPISPLCQFSLGLIPGHSIRSTTLRGSGNNNVAVPLRSEKSEVSIMQDNGIKIQSLTMPVYEYTHSKLLYCVIMTGGMGDKDE